MTLSSSTTALLLLIFLTYLLSAVLATSNSGPLIFDVDEEQPIGTEIGNVARPGPSTSEQQMTSRPRYSLRPSPSPYFHLDPRSGLLRTAVILDRETLCPYDEVCELVTDVIGLF